MRTRIPRKRLVYTSNEQRNISCKMILSRLHRENRVVASPRKRSVYDLFN